MASTGRGTDPSLKDLLFSETYRFSFFQAVRLLTRLNVAQTPVAGDVQSNGEVVRFRSHISLGFPPSEIYDLRENTAAQGPPIMTVAFMGLTGIAGVLPRHYTEYLLERMKTKDFVLRDFFDLFNHRMLSLFYQAWEKHFVPVQFEGARYARGKDDRFSKYVFALLGMGTAGLRGRLGADDHMLLRYAGLLSQRPRSATALRQWLSDYFSVPISIIQLIGEWLEVGEEDWSRMGTPGVNNRLGVSATAGTKVWEQQAGFEIRLGSMTYQKFKSILPSGDDFKVLVSMVSFFVGRELSFKIRPLLAASDVPECRLGTNAPCAAQLGWTTWLKTRACTKDADQVIFSGRYRPVSAVGA